ncbi:hypothetical protein MMPV_006773 [Pyropia vietnamensis]
MVGAVLALGIAAPAGAWTAALAAPATVAAAAARRAAAAEVAALEEAAATALGVRMVLADRAGPAEGGEADAAYVSLLVELASLSPPGVAASASTSATGAAGLGADLSRLGVVVALGDGGRRGGAFAADIPAGLVTAPLAVGAAGLAAHLAEAGPAVAAAHDAAATAAAAAAAACAAARAATRAASVAGRPGVAPAAVAAGGTALAAAAPALGGGWGGFMCVWVSGCRCGRMGW